LQVRLINDVNNSKFDFFVHLHKADKGFSKREITFYIIRRIGAFGHHKNLINGSA